MYLTKTIIFHDPTENFSKKGDIDLFRQLPLQKSLFGVQENNGLPIGNLTSQFFANVYLNSLDHFVKRQLKVRYYYRYVDDLVLLSESPQKLFTWRAQIERFLQTELKLKLHKKKDRYGSVYQGIDFVGYVTKPSYILCRRRVVNNLKTKLYIFNQRHKNGLATKKEIERITKTINSYFGHLAQADCYRLRKNIYQKHLGALKDHIRQKNDFQYVKLK